MQGNIKLFLDILSAYINNSKLNWEKLNNIDWNNIYHFASIHNVVGIVFVELKKSNINLYTDIAEKMQRDFLMTSINSINQEREAQKLIMLLNDNNILHLLSKGYILRNYYPDKELRTMGDIDILVSRSEFKKTADLLKNNGYVISDTYFNEVSFDKNGVHFEIHDNLLNEDLGNNFNYGIYFEKLCEEKKELIDGFTYKLDVESHLIYLIAHIGKHFYNEGCGIRMIMDIAVFINSFNSKIDWEYLWNELEKIKLKKFAENIFYLCNIWFASEVAVPEMSHSLYEEIEKYILEAGTFGFYERNSGVKLLRKSYGKGKSGSIMAWLFPSAADMRELSEWFNGKPGYMLPIAWIKRWKEAFMKKRGQVIDKACGAVLNRKEAERQYTLLKELGLYLD